MTIYPPAYPTSQDVQIYVSPNWVSIGAYVMGDIEGDDGILGNKPNDKMGRIGGMSLTLNNNTGLFVPTSAGAMAGFTKGAKIRVIAEYDEYTFILFKGTITTIGLPYSAEETSVVTVKAADWFYKASKDDVVGQGVLSNVTTAAAVTSLLTHGTVQPDATDIDTGTDILESVFTSVGVRSTVYSELAKLAASEFAYIYLRHDRTYGETLRVESRQSRTGVEPTTFPLPMVFGDTLALSDGDDFALSDGNLLALSESTTMTFNNISDADLAFAENLINELTVTYPPVRVDTSISALFVLNAPVFIASGATLPDLKVSYKNPTGGSGRINGANMIDPVSGTDWKAYANKNATGTNYTANISFTVEYGASGAVYTGITNAGPDAWITTLQARGYAVYVDQPVNMVSSDSASISANELSPYKINMQYQSNAVVAESVLTTVLPQNKDGRIEPQKIRLCANLSAYTLMAFLWLGVGDLIPVQEDTHSINAEYFIQSRKWSLTPGGVIWFEWGLVDAPFANDAVWELEIAGKSELEVTTFIGY